MIEVYLQLSSEWTMLGMVERYRFVRVPDSRVFVPESAASALWPDSQLNGAYCMPYPTMSRFPGGEGLRATVYPSRGVIRAHRGDSPEESWGKRK